MLRALFPGSFDPPTNGHLNILERASQIFDAIDVVVAVNPNKSYTFDAEERERMMQRMVSAFQNVEVHIWDQLI
ncbi:MAG: adenylyltransferase/cytidyltransferase family protein, partial [Spirochaetales bacterium]